MQTKVHDICHDETRTVQEKLFDLRIIRVALQQKFDISKGRATAEDIYTFRLLHTILFKTSKYRRGYTLGQCCS